jgi:hypothetical protein
MRDGISSGDLQKESTFRKNKNYILVSIFLKIIFKLLQMKIL